VEDKLEINIERMIEVRPAADRGETRIDWLDSKHSFSFADYHDPENMGFGVLRVINDDKVAPARGFGTHPHRDMEILSYVVEGELQHKDDMGNGSVIRRGDVQRMTAGKGVLHSEFNPSKASPVHFLQIWILPEKRGLEPGYEQKTFSSEEKKGRLRLVASRDGRDGSVSLHQDVLVYAAELAPGDRARHVLAKDRAAWVQIVSGKVTVNGQALASGDGAAIAEEDALEIVADADAELLVFDLSREPVVG
jgi:redox-sensitive bicupin YhaK (pirin superfamily)